MDKEFMKLAARAMQEKLPDHHGFVVLVAPFGEGGRLLYTSNIERESAIALVKEWLFMMGEKGDWMKHIQ